MEKKNGNVRTLILMMTAALFVVFIIAMMALVGNRNNDRGSIVLPGGESTGEVSGQGPDSGFVTVTPENASRVVLDLARPACYHQTLVQKTIMEGNTGTQTTEIWVCDGVWKIITSVGGQVRHVLTDGTTAYLWYRDESWNVKSVTLPQNMTPDDLAGILTYETIGDLSEKEIREATYVQLPEQTNAPCLYVATEADGAERRFWVDLDTGLLCKSVGLLDGAESYHMEQSGLAVLNGTDESLLQQMRLPDGTTPFTA